MALQGPTAVFDHSDYYSAEMGTGLQRRFFACAQRAPATSLGALKHAAWSLEQTWSADGQRQVNLDPGLLDLHKVVLASFKPGPQKLYLGDKVWADTVLLYDRGAYRPLPWTFPDLREGPHLDFFLQARAYYKQALRTLSQRKPPTPG